MIDEDIAFQWWNDELTISQKKWFFERHRRNGLTHNNEEELKRIALLVYEQFHNGNHLRVLQ